MKKFEIARYDAICRASDFMKDHDLQLSGLELYPDEKAAFNATLDKLAAAMQQQVIETHNITISKAMIKNAMAGTIYKFALRASVQAHQLGNLEIESALSKPITYISYCDDITSIGRAADLKNIMKNNSGILTVITADDIIEMESHIQTFSDIYSLPDDEIKTRKAKGTSVIHGLLAEIDIHKENIGKLVHSYLAELKNEWDAVTKVGKPDGIRHLSLALQFTSAESGIKLKDVICTVNNGKESIARKSSGRGWVRFYSLGSCDWTATCEFKGYETHTEENIGTKVGKVARFLIKLKKME